MIKLAFEYPLPHHEVFKKLQDYTFGLANYLLHDEEYRKKYPVVEILDNGMHEEGVPLTLPELQRATRLCKAQHVVVPDFLHDAKRTMSAFTPASIALEQELVAVVQAKTMDEVKQVYDFYVQQDVSIIAFPFKADRITWVKELRTCGAFDEGRWYHMMGLKDQYELEAIIDLGLQFCSLDTSKPIKAGIADCSMDLVRGQGALDIHRRLTADELGRAVELCEAMREICS